MRTFRRRGGSNFGHIGTKFDTVRYMKYSRINDFFLVLISRICFFFKHFLQVHNFVIVEYGEIRFIKSFSEEI